MSSPQRSVVVATLAAFTLLTAACGSDDASDRDASDTSTDAGGDQADSADNAEQPTIVVTTSVLGDVVDEIVGEQATVVTILPVGADPHDFQASAQEVNQIVSADALVTNGGDLEEGLVDVIDSARDEGVPTYAALDAVETIEFGEGGDGHSDEDHSDEGGHEGADPHFFTDPLRMAAAVDRIADFLAAEVSGLDAAELETSAAAYVAELEALDSDVTSLVDEIPADRRVLVTNHDAFGYFADRYGFEIVGAVIPGGSTTDAVSAGELAELAAVIEAEGVPAIFSETTASDELISVLADEVGDIDIVELYSGSLGEPGSDGATYLDMMRSNAQRISAALA